MYYTLVEERMYKMFKLTTIEFGENHLKIEYTTDYYAIDGDAGGDWEEYFTINEGEYNKIIERIKDVYKPYDLTMLNDDAKSFYKTIVNESAKLLFLYILSIEANENNKNSLHGDKLVNILCGKEIEYKRDAVFWRN